MMSIDLITPDWPAPANVKAFMTTRHGGVSEGQYASLNLGDHVQDNVDHVRENRQRLSALLPSEPLWLTQVHGTLAVDAAAKQPFPCEADASYTRALNVVSCVMTADCLPVLFCDRAGTQVAAAHAGWRGLMDGVLEATLAKFEQPADVLAWFGAAIGPQAFEVGAEVQAEFVQHDPQAAQAFVAVDCSGAGAERKYLGDLYQLARQRLQRAGMNADSIYGGGLCTYTDAERFFSFRRDGATGRMASCIWLQD